VQLGVPLQRTAGTHDLYLVFRNEQLKGDGLLFVLLTATFANGAAPAAPPAKAGSR
jgi:hypothetical protein